jgi:DNA replication protein DnaC
MLNKLTSELREMRLPGMALALEHWAQDPRNAEGAPLDCVAGLIAAQRQMAGDRRLSTFQSRHRLPPHMTLGAFQAGTARGLAMRQFNELKTLGWLDAGKNLVITGPSCSGKTHLAAGLAQEAISRGHKVKLEKVPEMLAAMSDEHTDKAIHALVDRLARPRLLVLDDFAVERANERQTAWLRRLMDRRVGRGVTIATATAELDEWGAFFDNPVSAEGIFGRLVDGSLRVQLRRPQRGKADDPPPA